MEQPQREKLATDVIMERLGAGKTYLLLGDAMDKKVVGNFTFKSWRDVFISASIEQNAKVAAFAFIEMNKRAVSLPELAFSFICEKDEEAAADLLQRMSQLGSTKDWLGILAGSLKGSYAIPARTSQLEVFGGDIVKAAVLDI
ncbi:MAG: hypothetical protein HGA36_00320 [Candidatus Moranbacteria bacterium]|nr:hypothetical protein [Candidatus Moranbacteria bacterium]